MRRYHPALVPLRHTSWLFSPVAVSCLLALPLLPPAWATWASRHVGQGPGRKTMQLAGLVEKSRLQRHRYRHHLVSFNPLVFLPAVSSVRPGFDRSSV